MNNISILPSTLPNQIPYSLLVESVQDYAIFMMDPSGYILSWNQGAKNIKGYTHEEIIGKHFSLFYTTEDQASDKITQILLTAAQVGKYEEEGWRVRKDGSLFWASILITALYDNNNKLTGFAKVTRDLTEKKKMEEKLSFSEERVRLLVEGIKDYAIFMLDPQGFITTWSSGAENIKGYKADEIIGKHFSIFYFSEDNDSSKPYWELKVALRDGKYEEEGWRLRKDGSTFWANVLITPIYDASGELKGFAKITRDLSEKISSQQDLLHIQEHNNELIKSNEDLNEFTQIIAHDFREPLRGISNFASILVDELTGRLNKEEQHILGSLKKQAIRISMLLDSLLKISLANYFTPKPIATDLNNILEEVTEILSHFLEENNVKIRIPQPLPTIYCDPIRIREVFNNLITNAAKYNDKKEKWIEIGWSEQEEWAENTNSEQKKRLITFYVRDNGIGIKDKDFSTIFKPFKRLNGRSEYGEGTGIGLNLIKKIIDRHEGKIWVESVPDLGTTFFFSIPTS